MSYYWREALYVAPFAVLGGALCFLLRRKRGGALGRELLLALLAGYAVELFALLLTPRNLIRDFWYWLRWRTPPREAGWAYYAPVLDAGRWRILWKLRRLRNREALANALLFVPFGALVPSAWRCVGWRAVPLGLALSAAVELLQLPLGRSADVRDVLMNTLGVAAGYLCYCVARRRN
ncbi:MAG: VanZ family protein [Oscillospiraceae bacterium]|nr:VanZ family protein [Oscillospiraceae bacterium]